MKTSRVLLAVSFVALSSCDRSDSICESNDLKAMVGKNVLVTTTHLVALSATTLPDGFADHDTAIYIRGELTSVNASGVVLNRGGNQIWIDRKLVISIATNESSKQPKEPKKPSD